MGHTPARYEVSSVDIRASDEQPGVSLGLGLELGRPEAADKAARAVELAAMELLKEQGLDRRLHQAEDNTKRFLQGLLEDWAREYRGVVAALAQRGVDPALLNHARLRQPCFKVPGGRAELNVSLEDIITSCNSHQAGLQAFTVYVDANRMSKWARSTSKGDLQGRVALNLLEHYVSMVEIARQVAGASGGVAHAVSRLCSLADDPSLRHLSLSAPSMALAQRSKDGSEADSGAGGATSSSSRKRRRLDADMALPSDAAILVNLFCAYLDAQLPRSTRTERPFTRRFLLEGMPPNPDVLQNQILLLQWRSSPTHFKVVVRGEVWEAQPGRRNAIHAIMLLLHAIKKYKTGYIAGHNFNKFIDNILPLGAKPNPNPKGDPPRRVRFSD
uniref:Uncharacterized protein n=1 Tax=Phaeomonas parva TaxID=124430 RepID=A0A7S1XJ82_9STRA